MSVSRPPEPPRWADALLAWFCAPDLLEAIQGDLHELYHKRVRRHGRLRARLHYWLDVVRFFRPHVLRRRKPAYEHARGPIMWANYVKVASRHLSRQKGYAFINVLGLAIGIMCAILALIYVGHELRYDQHHEKVDRIYRVAARNPGGTYADPWALTQAPLATTLSRTYPEIEAATTLKKATSLLSRKEQKGYEEGLFADESFLDLFTVPVVGGNARAALQAPGSIVLTVSLAKRYFGDADPIGQTIRHRSPYRDWNSFTVTGIIEDTPGTSHISFDFLTSIQNYQGYLREMEDVQVGWNNNSFYTYILLHPEADPVTFGNKLAGFNDALSSNGLAAISRQYFLQPLADIHLHSRVKYEIQPNGDIRYVYLVSFIALVILLIACINYMNLSTARSAQRAQEVGIRKVIGAQRGQLVRQFLGESIFVALASVVLALGLVVLLLPYFNQLVDRQIEVSSLNNAFLLIGVPGIGVLVGLLAGSYPALFLAAMQSVDVLKGRQLSRGSMLRSLLVISQFGAAIVLVVSSVVIYQQLTYMREKKLGFNRDQVVMVPIREDALWQQAEVLKNELQRHPNITAVSFMKAPPGQIGSTMTVSDWEGHQGDETVRVFRAEADYDFIGVFGLALIAGRAFSEDIPSDAENAFVLNETAVQALGWTPQEAVGKQFSGGEVIGVVRDFHFQSLHEEIAPLLLRIQQRYTSSIGIKVRPGNLEETLTFLEKRIREVAPDVPYDYHFLDDAYDQLYQAERQFGQLIGSLTLLALFVACLGLFSLASYMAEVRTKEIGVRKVLGASLPDIIFLLSKDFLRLILIAFVLAAPLGYLAINHWLQDFAYRIDLSWSLWLVVGGCMLMLTLLTVSYQSVRAALADPVKALRYE